MSLAVGSDKSDWRGFVWARISRAKRLSALSVADFFFQVRSEFIDSTPISGFSPRVLAFLVDVNAKIDIETNILPNDD